MGSDEVERRTLLQAISSMSPVTPSRSTCHGQWSNAMMQAFFHCTLTRLDAAEDQFHLLRTTVASQSQASAQVSDQRTPLVLVVIDIAVCVHPQDDTASHSSLTCFRMLPFTCSQTISSTQIGKCAEQSTISSSAFSKLSVRSRLSSAALLATNGARQPRCPTYAWCCQTSCGHPRRLPIINTILPAFLSKKTLGPNSRSNRTDEPPATLCTCHVSTANALRCILFTKVEMMWPCMWWDVAPLSNPDP